MRKQFKVSVLITFLFCFQAKAIPERIVTLAPNLAEWVAEIVGKDETQKHLVGVSEYSDYPSWIKSTESIGPYPQVNIEKILKLKPTVVIALLDSNSDDQLKQLEKLKLKVIRMPAENFNKMDKWIQKLGSELGESLNGLAAANRWKSQIQKMNLKLKRVKKKDRKLFIEVQAEPVITVGGHSFLSDAFKFIGYKNVFSNLNQSYPKVSRESVIAANPDHIFILDLSGKEEDFKRSLDQWRKFKSLKAVANDEVKFLKGDDYGRCSFRLLYALEKLI